MMLEKLDLQPVIDAGRFSLRPLRRSDAGLIALYAGDLRVARGTRAIPHPLPPGLAEGVVDRALNLTRTEDVWAIDGTAMCLPEVTGLVHLTRMDRRQSEISYWVAPGFWNAGIASDAVRAMVAANPQASAQIFAEVFQDAGSARVLTNAGFSYLGDAEAFSVARGQTVPTWTYMVAP
jgi:RimJ/RimL family protein N-acetyltransferase